MSADRITELYGDLKGRWVMLKNEKASNTDRSLAAQKIIEISNELAKLDPKFKPFDLYNSSYASFVPNTAPKADLKEPKPKLLREDDIEAIKNEARRFFETKQIVEYIAKTEFPSYDNGPSVGQATENVHARLITY